MGSKDLTGFHFLVLDFLLKIMFWFLGFLCKSLFFVFGAVVSFFPRFEESETIGDNSGVDSGKNEGFEMGFVNHEDSDECKRENDRKSSVFAEPVSMTSKYQFVSGKNICGFVEEPRIMSLTVQEMFVGPTDSDDFAGENRISGKRFSGKSSFETEDSVLRFSFGLVPEKIEEVAVFDIGNGELGKRDFSGEAQFCSDFDSSHEPDSIGSDYDSGSSENVIGEIGFEIQTKSDSEPVVAGESSGDDSGEKIDDEATFCEETEQMKSEKPSSDDSENDSDEEIENEAVILEKTGQTEAEKHSSEDSDDVSGEESDGEDAKPIETDQIKSEKRGFSDSDNNSDEKIENDAVILEKTGQKEAEKQSSDDSDNVSGEEIDGEDAKSEKPMFDESEDDVGWDLISEHQDLIEQLKIELKHVRVGGLPTILEESESPKIAEDLKPLRISEKRLEHKDRVEQIQKVYKNYAEKMKKLDVLNYQTMHAIGFIRRKDQSQIIRKPSAMKLPFLLSKARVVGDDPVGDLERDLELVYVGQACLSWKILHWQYEKAKELCDYDPQGFRHYNEVAGEFQLFHVLLQRYVEDETFQGPRIQYYVKNRCVIKTLLQVPVIKDDKDKKCLKGEEKSTIPIAMLQPIIHQCMQVFWAFLRADKKATNTVGSLHFQPDLQNACDKTLFTEVQIDLQKKERKLKDILRTRNCIVKKFQKMNGETRIDHTTLVAQIELRLVSRVMNMSRLSTQQLVWCHEQLGKIEFCSGRICLEPSFLLFPC